MENKFCNKCDEEKNLFEFNKQKSNGYYKSICKSCEEDDVINLNHYTNLQPLCLSM